jgi:hypothetical protein
MGESKYAQAKSITVGIVKTIPTTLYYSAVATPQRTRFRDYLRFLFDRY